MLYIFSSQPSVTFDNCSGPSSSCSGREATESSSDLEDVGENDLGYNCDDGEGEEAVDGLVLMGSSTRLRPAAAEAGGGADLGHRHQRGAALPQEGAQGGDTGQQGHCHG